MPVIFIYAINSTAGRDSKQYECPIYRKPNRTITNYIGSIDFESDKGPIPSTVSSAQSLQIKLTTLT